MPYSSEVGRGETPPPSHNPPPMKCSHCGKPIVLVPSASERARKFGGVASDYTRLFTIHADCQLELRKRN